MLNKFGDELIKDIVIEWVDQSTETMNEFLSAAVQRDTPETGYEKFHLRNFEGLETPLEESVVQRVTQKLTHVQDLAVTGMYLLPNEVRHQFVDFVADIIE